MAPRRRNRPAPTEQGFAVIVWEPGHGVDESITQVHRAETPQLAIHHATQLAQPGDEWAVIDLTDRRVVGASSNILSASR